MSRHAATHQMAWTAGRAGVGATPALSSAAPVFEEWAEEAPGAYKDVSAVVEAADRAGVSKKCSSARTADLHQGVIPSCIQMKWLTFNVKCGVASHNSDLLIPSFSAHWWGSLTLQL